MAVSILKEFRRRMDEINENFKKEIVALVRLLSVLVHRLIHQKAAGSILSQGTYLGCGFKPRLGHVQEENNQCLFSLCKINKHPLVRIKKDIVSTKMDIETIKQIDMKNTISEMKNTLEKK